MCPDTGGYSYSTEGARNNKKRFLESQPTAGFPKIVFYNEHYYSNTTQKIKRQSFAS
jgi:hypothetical protein